MWITNTSTRHFKRKKLDTSLDRSAGSKHLLDKLTVGKTTILVGYSSGLIPLGLRKLVSHRSQGSVELVSINLTSSTGIEDGESTRDGSLIIRLSKRTQKWQSC